MILTTNAAIAHTDNARDHAEQITINSAVDSLANFLYEIECQINCIGNNLFSVDEKEPEERLDNPSVLGRLLYMTRKAEIIAKKTSIIRERIGSID